MSKVVLVTGANSGIGRSTAVRMAEKGWTVYGTMRDLAKGEKLRARCEAAGVEVRPLVCDVTDDATVAAAVSTVLEEAGALDALVNNAGVASNGTVEETSVAVHRQVMDANLYGVIRFVQAVLPHMRERGDGCIVNVSSIIGRFAAPGQAAYTASKWALEGLSEELAHEVARFGIRVAIVEPGIVKTAILAKNLPPKSTTGVYDHTYARMAAMYAAGLRDPSHPDDLADVIHEAITTERPKLRWLGGWGAEEFDAAFRRAIWDEFVALGGGSDDEFYDGFERLYGLALR